MSSNLDVRDESDSEVSDGRENVGFRGQSGSRFGATECLLVAKLRRWLRVSATSGVGGEADEIRGKADIGTHAAWLAELDKSAITH